MDYYGNNDWRDYHLAHYGVKGMKWRNRKGRVVMGPNGKLLYLYGSSPQSSQVTRSGVSTGTGKPIRRKKKVESGGTGVNRQEITDRPGGRVGYTFKPVQKVSKVKKAKYTVKQTKNRLNILKSDYEKWKKATGSSMKYGVVEYAVKRKKARRGIDKYNKSIKKNIKNAQEYLKDPEKYNEKLKKKAKLQGYVKKAKVTYDKVRNSKPVQLGKKAVLAYLNAPTRTQRQRQRYYSKKRR